MTAFNFEIPNLNTEQNTRVSEVLDALKVFLVAPNAVATEKNNLLQKAAGDARKAILGDSIKKPAKKKNG